ncbi:Carboxypeptidase Q [Smittium mucronatum]|uniref:Peptide hydrolase n=1 Tax=Smittium mucronatum TaxID=133383 RepID=A0A1R0GQ83_9FUNG|nr:Carboxypeptidase Q [Smittium mucronatum]
MKSYVNVCFLAILAFGDASPVYGGTDMKVRSAQMVNLLLDNAGNVNDTSVWDSLAEMTDLYGHRMTGHIQYDRSVSWVIGDAKRYPSFTAWEEPVTVNVWNRNTEYAQMNIPTRSPPTVDLPMLGLGQSIGTGPEGIEADVIPVETFEDLEALGNSTIAGNIVLFCADFVSYRDNAKYRFSGASMAEKYGAVAVLVQSITGYSLMTPHTGAMNPASIPGAAITIEDSKLIQRMYNRYNEAQKNPSIPNSEKFIKPRVKLVMNAESYENAKVSSNIIIDLKGSDKSDEIVLISGHFDSWDVGVGAMDDGGGAFSAYGALKMIANLPARPSRTIRVVMWNNEETLGRGMYAYTEAHKDEISKHIFAMESDVGNFNPWGMQVMGTDDAIAKLDALGKMFLTTVGGGNITKSDDPPDADIETLCNMGVTCGGFEPLDKYTQAIPLVPAGTEGYFRFHHTQADRMEVLDKNQLRANSVAMAVWAYILADQ